MDIFNKNRVKNLESELEKQKKIIEHNLDIIAMMDDEILQVAKAVYLRKILKFQPGTTKDNLNEVYVDNILCNNGILQMDICPLPLTDCIELEITLSHLHNIASVVG